MDQNQEFSIDTFFNGRIVIRQSRIGYRFSIDAVLLAASVRPKPDDAVVDLGTGCGIIPLILAYRYPTIRIFGVEVQEELAALAQKNVGDNGFEDRIQILHMDMKKLPIGSLPNVVNLVVCNPPYRKAHSGRINPNRQRARARHEVSITLPELIFTAQKILQKSGKFVMIYPIHRLTDVLTTLRSSDLEPKFIRHIHSQANTEAKLLLIEAVRGGRSGLKVAAPLYIYNADGGYTKAVQRMFQAS